MITACEFGDINMREVDFALAKSCSYMKFDYKIADMNELKLIWEKNIADNPGDPRWPIWRDIYVGYNEKQMATTFIVAADGIPVGEGTLILSPECGAAIGRPEIADGHSVANVNALRIDKQYEGRHHISRLVRMIEAHARSLGYERITIGVEAKETRNLAIYLHWGYTRLVSYYIEDDELVLYYEKPL